MNDNGGFPSGALGILSPVQPETGTNNALSGEMTPQGIAMTMEIDAGVARSRTKFASRFDQVTLWMEGTGVTG
jgi:hypothetical protein